MTTVFGIDIQKGNIRSQSVAPRFCLVRVEDGKVISEEKGVSIPKLFRLLRAERPDILAVDSVQEIAPSDKELFSFLSAMPAETKLVQVTGDGIKMESLPAVAARYNLKFDKTNPAEEAKASALVASFGGGYEVVAFEGVTTVTISRGRSLGRGGWSQNRYVRKVHGGVKTRAREIEAKLAEAGLSYTVESRRAFGGESRTIISVRAPRAEVPVVGMKSGDIQVHVIPKRKDKISYLPLTKKTSYVIVGLDPGTTVGLSILDLNGNLLHTASVRAQSPAEVIAEISRIGKPVVVATDKAEMPAGVEKIRRAFAAVPWTPKKDILIKEKYAAAEGYEFADDHQRDSLAAAVLAFRSFQPKFENLKKRLPAGTDIDFVRAGIIRGKTLDKILSVPVIQDEEVPEAEVEVFADEKDLEIARLEGEVAKLRKLIRGLSEDLEAKDKAVKKLQRRLSLERNERTADVLLSEEITSRDRELAQTKKALRKEERRNKTLRTRIDRMKNYVALQAGDGCLAIKVMELLSRDAVKSVDEEMGVNDGDILYVLKIDGWGKSVIRDLADAKIKAVIFPKLTHDRAREQHLIEEFRKINLPALSGVNLSPRVKGKIGVVNEAAFTKALSEWDTAEEVFLKERRQEEFSGMVEEYQVQRRREVNVLGIDPATLPYNQHVPELPQKPKVKPAPVKEAPKPKPKPVQQKITVPEKPKKVEKKEEPKTEDIFSAVLQAYRKERKKEMGKTENG